MTLASKNRLDKLQQGQIPKGYRLTRLGIAPNDWMMFRIGDCLERVERPVDVQANKLYTQIGIRSHGKGLFYKEPVTGAELGNKAVFWIEPNCFILNIVFAWEQAIGKTTQAEEGMIGSHRFPMYRPINNRVDTDYLIYYFLTKRGREILEAASPGGAGRNKTLGQDRFLKSKIVLPPLAEQRKIAKILATQDRVIELKKKLLEERLRQKKYLMRQLLTGKQRLPGFDGKWKNVKLSEVLLERKEKNSGQNHRICSVAVKKGVVDQIEHLGRSYAAADTSNYGVAHYGDVIYTKSPSGEFPYGIVKQSQMKESVAVSPLYGIFEPVNYELGYVLHTYFGYTINCSNYLLPIIQKGAKNTINITNGVFVSNCLYLPVDYKEQKALAKVFITADREIGLLRQNLEQEERKKKALMQLLLTGIVRV